MGKKVEIELPEGVDEEQMREIIAEAQRRLVRQFYYAGFLHGFAAFGCGFIAYYFIF